ncbi:MAG: transporter [Deltaproteobacteria bacterium]|jgi:MFS family permease|nr:transporter [Deltaproteobacteria bacterium]
MSRVYYGWWVVGACFGIMLYVSGVIFFGFTSFFDPLIREFGWSYAQVSFAASLTGLEMGVFAPLVGFLVDRFGSRRLLLFGFTAMGFGLILLSHTQSLAMFYGCFLIIAFGAGGCASVVTVSAVASWFDKNLGKALGIAISGFGASGLLIPLVVHLIDTLGWRGAFFTLGIGMWVVGIPLSLVVKTHPRQIAMGLLESSGEGIGLEVSSSIPAPRRMREILRSRVFTHLNATEAIRMIVVTGAVVHVMPYLESIGMTRSRAAVVAAAMPLCSIAGRFGFGWLADVYEKKMVLASALSLMGAGVLTFSFADKDWALYLFLALFPPGFGGSVVLRGAIVREYFGLHSFGKLLGITMGCASVGGLIGPILTGWTYDHLGTYRYTWFAFFFLVVIAVGLVLRMPPSEKTRDR